MAQEVHRGRRGAGLALGFLAVLGTVGTVLLLRKPTTPASTPGTAGALGIAIASATVVSSQAGPVATLTLTNGSTQAQAIPISGVIQYQGQQLGVFTTATTPTIQPGQSITVTLQSAAPIASNYAGDTLTAVFSLPDGTTSQATFTVTGLAAFTISAPAVQGPVQVGQTATATVTITNTGSAPGSIAVSGVSELNGQVVGHWD